MLEDDMRRPSLHAESAWERSCIKSLVDPRLHGWKEQRAGQMGKPVLEPGCRVHPGCADDVGVQTSVAVMAGGRSERWGTSQRETFPDLGAVVNAMDNP